MTTDTLTSAAQAASQPSVNALTAPLLEALVRDAAALRVGCETDPSGSRIVDAGIDHPGGIEAGRRIAEICMGGLGQVQIICTTDAWPTRLSVHSSDPVLCCLGSQYAGWSLAHGEGKKAFHALGSGPGRALAGKEALFGELKYQDHFESACLVLEVSRPPPPEIIEKVATACALPPDRLTFILTPTRSLAGMTQIVARVLEVALHKAHTLGFPLSAIVDGAGSAPLPPPGGDFLESMGRSNDAILFGGRVQLFVSCSDAEAADLAARLPSSSSRDYGKPFAQIFREYEHDFYKIDPMLFAPAAVIVSNLTSGKTFRAGKLDDAALIASFSGE
jgi:methenyltetrahydromethanopterin cyclohydrolase